MESVNPPRSTNGAEPPFNADQPGREKSRETASVAETVKEAAKDTKEQVVEEVKGRAASFVQRNKEILTDQIEAFADSLRASGERLPNETLSDYAFRAAGQLESLADTIRQRDLRDVVDEVRYFATQQPAVFLGGMFATGFLAARFFRSSPTVGAESHESFPRRSMVGESEFGEYSSDVTPEPIGDEY